MIKKYFAILFFFSFFKYCSYSSQQLLNISDINTLLSVVERQAFQTIVGTQGLGGHALLEYFIVHYRMSYIANTPEP